jgi:hypothetical protein
MRSTHQHHDHGPEQIEQGNGRSRKLRAGLAGLAVLGLGAGLTLAAWTGNVNFAGTASASEDGTFQLQGLVNDGTTPDAGAEWSDVDVAFTFEELSNDGETQTLWVRDSDGRAITLDGAGGFALQWAGGKPTWVVAPDAVQFTQVGGEMWSAPLTMSANAAGDEASVSIDVTGELA